MRIWEKPNFGFWICSFPKRATPGPLWWRQAVALSTAARQPRPPGQTATLYPDGHSVFLSVQRSGHHRRQSHFATKQVLCGATLVAPMVESAGHAGDPGSIPGSGRCSGEGNGSVLNGFAQQRARGSVLSMSKVGEAELRCSADWVYSNHFLL